MTPTLPRDDLPLEERLALVSWQLFVLTNICTKIAMEDTIGGEEGIRQIMVAELLAAKKLETELKRKKRRLLL